MASAGLFALLASSGVATPATEHLDTVSLLQSQSSEKVGQQWPLDIEKLIAFNSDEAAVEKVKSKGVLDVDAIRRIEIPVDDAIDGVNVINGNLPCPQADMEPEKDFDIQEYIRASWFVQMQQEVPYQTLDQFRCVVATYHKDISKDDLTLNVYNYRLGGYRTAKRGSYKREVPQLCAKLGGEYDAGLKVAPCLVQDIFPGSGGDYWVVKVGKKADGTYAWAIVSGGRPSFKEVLPVAFRENYNIARTGELPYNWTGKCTTPYGKKAPQEGSGLWLFSRTPELEPEMLAEAKAWLVDNGFTLRHMYPVLQGKKWCYDYPGSYLKFDLPGKNTDLLYQSEIEALRTALR